MPKLSVITINFNDKNGLEKTMQSLVSQTFKNVEFILIDGGSTDGSVDVIKTYADKITHWVSERDKGIYNAQNKGIAKSKGEYCLFLNSGDYLASNTILEEVFSKNLKEDIIYGDMMIDKGEGKLYYGKHPDAIDFDFMIYTTLWHPVSFIKKSLFEKYGFYNEELKITSDYDFFLNTIIVLKATTKHIPVAVSVFNTFGIGSSKENKKLHEQERKFVQEKYFDKKEIGAAKARIKKQRGNKALISDWLEQFPIVKKTASFLYQGIKNKGEK